MRILILCLLIVLNVQSVTSQEIKINLKQKTGYGPFKPEAGNILFSPPNNHPLFNTFSKLEFNNIPDDLIEVKKGIIPFDFLQFLFQNLHGTENYKFYENFKKQRSYEISNEVLSTKQIKCFVRVIFAKNTQDNPIYIIDANQNGNFNDDPIIQIESIQSLEELKNKNLKIIESSYQISNGKNTLERKIPIIVFFHRNELKYNIPSYMVGNIKNQKDIFISHDFIFPDYWVSTINIDNGNSNIKKNDIFQLDNKYYKNNGVDIRSNTLLLTEEKNNNQRFTLNNLEQPDIKSDSTINLDDYKGKYLFIDFWGSWCAPCLQELPILSSIYNEIDKSKIDFIGIAGRDEPKKALKVIIDHNISWKNILSNDSNKLAEIFNVVKYPTGFLINPDGNIIESDLSVIELRPYLRKYKLLKQGQ